MARIYQTQSVADAQIRAALVTQPGQADLCVHRVGSWGQARGDELWYITRDRDSATVRVHFGSIGMSQVKVCFVDSYGEAGWNRAHRLKGRF